MSSTPNVDAGPESDRLPMTLPRIAEKKRLREPIVMITAYDFPTARIVEEAGIDIVLVGDSAAEVVLGYGSTVAVSIEEMLMLTAAVRRGLRTPLLVGDLPFGSYEASDEQAVRSAQRFVKESGADAVKLEGGGPTSVARVKAIVGAGIPVMGHVGLTPQTTTALGGRRAQGRTAERALALGREARELESAGCFAIVLEAIPAAVAAQLTDTLSIPTIGIGAGPETSGQVLVVHDMLGVYPEAPRRHAKRYIDLHQQMLAAIGEYAEDVRERRFPAPENTFSIDPAELRAFSEGLQAL
ncbi:MAG: 3-methyl-2-oxobutanoate hydroxymethyltransferase [Solirubrobacteraceae bacterium]|jgi:3-methyl-2-oxobutanoate hydroxymethyltransferase